MTSKHTHGVATQQAQKPFEAPVIRAEAAMRLATAGSFDLNIPGGRPL